MRNLRGLGEDLTPDKHRFFMVEHALKSSKLTRIVQPTWMSGKEVLSNLLVELNNQANCTIKSTLFKKQEKDLKNEDEKGSTKQCNKEDYDNVLLKLPCGEDLFESSAERGLLEDENDRRMFLTGPCLDDVRRRLFHAERLLEIYDVFLKRSVDTHRSGMFAIMLKKETSCHRKTFIQPTYEQYAPIRDSLATCICELHHIVGRKRFTDICEEILKKPELLQHAKMRDQIWELVKEAMQRVVEKMLEGHTDCEHLTAEFFKHLEKQYGQSHNMGDAVKDSKLLVKTLSYLYENKDTYGHRFEMICEQILKEHDWLRLFEMRGPIRDCLRVALLRVVEKMRGGQTHHVNFIKGFSECVKRLYEQHEHKLFNMGETVEESKLLAKSSVELRVNMGLKIHEKVLRQKFNFTNSLLFDIDRLSGLLKLMSLEELVIASKAMMEEMINSQNHAVVCFLSNALLLLICGTHLCQGTLFNCKKKSRLKYKYEKATLLILWRCGDVEQNPGPAISDITRDFCKKMISMLVDKYWKLKPEEKPKRTNKYETEPDGWPKDVWYGDPSKGTNEQRNNMLKTFQEKCIDNGVEVPSKWLNVIEKYLSKKANARHLYTWLCCQRSIETIDQMFDRLPDIDKEGKDEILEHMFKHMKSHLPDLSSQCLQSRKLGPKSRKMEFETQATILPESEINCATDEVATFVSCTTNINAADLLAVDGVLDPNGTSVVQVTPEIDNQKTSNDSFVVGNKERSTAQPDNLSSTSFFLLSDNTTRFAASNTTVTPLPYACENNGDTANINDDNYRKRKLDTREDGYETAIATKRYKMPNCGDCETVVSFPNGDDVHVPPFNEIFPSTKENGIQSGFAAEKALATCEVGDATVIATKRYHTSDCRDYENAAPVANDGDVSDFQNTEENGFSFGFVAEETPKDLMAVIEPELLEINTIPYHNAVVKPGEVQGDIYNDPLLDEVSKCLSDEFLMELSLTT